ncbi:MAG: hypothetical protein NC094_13450 [Bacteroidales bacterium]|nr:hypothetical protein [Lachnoclostridium sp.]MCM1385552.1 hypothetical protein [Lachnoclostridium sp.]MCM1466410.1 hypothetical protein [Bacteroidales bacterium]
MGEKQKTAIGSSLYYSGYDESTVIRQKSQELFSVIGTRLTSRLNNLDYDKIICLDGTIVNKSMVKMQKKEF